MARPGITKDQVFDAADALAREGQSPTVVAVRSRLGGGSPNNITKWLSEWKTLHETQKAETLPPLPEGVESAMRQVWGAAWKDAQGQLEGEREALNTARKDIEKERTEMLGEIEQLDQNLERTQHEILVGKDTLDTERQAHHQTRSELRESRAISEERKQRINAQEMDLRELRSKIQDAEIRAGRLEAELAHAQQDIAREKQHQAQTQRQAERLQGDLTQARGENDRLRAELESAKRHAKEAKGIADAAGKKIQRLEAALDEERQARTAAEKAAAELRVEAATLTERAAHAEELRERVQELRGQLVDQSKPKARRTPSKRGGNPQEDGQG